MTPLRPASRGCGGPAAANPPRLQGDATNPGESGPGGTLCGRLSGFGWLGLIGEGWSAVEIDPTVASPARMYDYYLGGKDNNAADREAAEQALAAVPEGRRIARDNRAFLLRAVDYLAGEAGVGQFLDIGTGIPTSPNVHEVARRHIPDARVVYVDNDPVVTAHNRALRATHDGVVGLAGDLRAPMEILDHPDCRRVLDLSRPVAVICVAVFQFVTDDHDAAVLDALRTRLAAGSHLVLTVMTSDHQPPATVERLRAAYSGSAAPATLRGEDHIAAMFDGFDLVDPGLTLVNRWRPDTETPGTDTGWLLAGVARKP